MSQLTEYYKIIQRFSSLYAGEGDDELARHAADAITPVAEKGNTKAQYMLGRYYSWGYHHQCDNQKAICWFEKAADKGNDKAAEALANLYRYDFADDEMIDAQAKKDFVHKWHYRWIEILEAKAAKGVAGAAQALMKLYRQIASRRNLYGKYNHEVSVAQHENGNIAAENALNNKKFRMVYQGGGSKYLELS